MTAYTVAEINNSVAKIQFNDGTFAFIELSSDMTEADFDNLANNLVPLSLKTGEGTPSFLTEGASRTAVEIAPVVETDDRPQWLIDRIDAYGTTNSQLEYITENGLAAWQAHVAQIKSDNPKG